MPDRTLVSTGWRPGGSSRITDTSRSPYAVSASVRGIGVAVITSTSGCMPLRRSVARWITPKRCCSSMIAKPSCLKRTVSCTSAWVPTASCALPSASRAHASRRSFAPVVPVSRTGSKRDGANSRAIFRKCCSASSSVGAMKAACNPFSIATSAARSATMVLPDPTSPCSSRFIGCVRRRSSTISFNACRWWPVRRNGSTSRAARRMRSSTAIVCGLRSVSVSRRFNARPSWNTKNSSKISRSCAADR